MKKLLFIADPVSKIRPKTDTTLYMIRAARDAGADAYWALPESLELRHTDLWVAAAKVKKSEEHELPELGDFEMFPLALFRGVFIRKDPPFDSSYQRLCWLLCLEEGRVHFLNPPSLLLRYHEKLIPFEAVKKGFLRPDDLIETHIGPRDSAAAFIRDRQFETWIEKPFLGYGGNGVRLAHGTEPSNDPVWDHLVQPFIPGVQTAGDRRVFFVNGREAGSFVRVPKEGGYLSNLAQGGTAKLVPYTPEEADRVGRLGEFLASVGIVLAGADLLDGRVSEVNITSPTGFPSLKRLAGIEIAPRLIQTALGV